ncbi:MAG: bacteriophage abortive infection AbiH family protein [Prevotella sp.]|nr:bacteriophage abortive infection AbiH family protein [Prevotella sp.]
MNSTLPKLKEHEGNTLYIIGNGFDLHHGISSRFKDFCCWLKREDVKEEQFVRDMQIIFPHLNQEEASLWSNFEDALGSYDLDGIISTTMKVLTML